MRSEYRMGKGRFFVVEEELGIEIDEPFSPRCLPSFANLHQEADLQIEKNEEIGEISAGYVGKEGLEGEWCLWSVQGELKARCYYLGGELHGPSNVYGEKGTLLSTGWFYHGKQHGIVRRYDLFGTLLCREGYINGQKEGRQLFYYPNQALKTEMEYKGGKLHGLVHLFWEDGRIKRQSAFVEGKRDGMDQIWNREGTLLYCAHYDHGFPIGTHCHWQDNGVMIWKRIYHTREQFDEWKWDDRGNVVFSGVFEEDGSYCHTTWKEGKKEMRLGKFKNGQLELGEPFVESVSV